MADHLGIAQTRNVSAVCHDVIDLPARPARSCAGDDLPLGTYQIIAVASGGFTVQRRIGAQTWYPLTEAGAFLRWPTHEACAASCMAGDLFDFSYWPQWGAA